MHSQAPPVPETLVGVGEAVRTCITPTHMQRPAPLGDFKAASDAVTPTVLGAVMKNGVQSAGAF